MNPIKTCKKFTKENEATSWLLSFIRKENPGRFLWKIPDIGNVQKPFDVVGVKDDGIGLAWEIKVIKSIKMDYETIYKKLEIHQIISLNKVSKAGGEALVVGYHVETNSFIFYPFK